MSLAQRQQPAGGQPRDKYEREAYWVAEQVMRVAEPHLQQQAEEKEEELIQTKSLAGDFTPLARRQIEEEEEKI